MRQTLGAFTSRAAVQKHRQTALQRPRDDGSGADAQVMSYRRIFTGDIRRMQTLLAWQGVVCGF